MSNLIKKPSTSKNLKRIQEHKPNRRYSMYATETHLNTSNNDHNSRRYNEGSVYRQASRFNPYLSSSTNISSSLSGSVELIVSDLEVRIDSQSRLDLSKLKETSNEYSEDQEAVFIQSLISQKQTLRKKINCKEDELKSIIQELQILQICEKLNREKHLHNLRLQVLKSFNYFK